MPVSCAAISCFNASNKPECHSKKISFHKFPLNDNVLLNKWLLNLRRKDYTPNEHSKLCSAHFEEDCFKYQNFTNRRQLKAEAVPTKFLHSMSGQLPKRLCTSYQILATVAKTPKYIVKTFFEEQQGSDVTIKALNRTWHLHKLYLSQSPYFSSMLNGIWLETQKKEIEIHVDDSNVTSEALNKVFSSFYQDEIKIEPEEAVPVIGAATLLQMDHICQQCMEVMKCNVNIDTAVSYYENADFYSLEELKNVVFDWLLKNLLYTISKSPVHLNQISCELMAELVKSPNLLVIQTEFSVYLLLKKWLFLKESRCILDEELNYDNLAHDYFRGRVGALPYLMSEQGRKYQKAFFPLRKNHLINHGIDLNVIEMDNIIPSEWFLPVFKYQWLQMLQIEEGSDLGPTELSEELFNKFSSRVGRIINTDKETIWRWSGFNYGFDLIVYYNKGTISLSRGHILLGRQDTDVQNRVAMQHKDKVRKIMYRISIYSLDKKGKVHKKQETGLKNLSLAFHEQKVVMNLTCSLKFPVLFSANFLLTTPLDDSSLKKNSSQPD